MLGKENLRFYFVEVHLSIRVFFQGTQRKGRFLYCINIILKF